MKRIFTIFISFVFIYSIYYDLTTGTLPTKTIEAQVENDVAVTTEEQKEDEVEVTNDKRYVEVLVEPGYTVLSVVEHLHEGPIPASIQEIVYDFKQLNNIEPEQMKIGHTYRFPYYQ